MSTNLELLALAATAAGWRVISSREFGGLNVDVGGGRTIIDWNPLADDGDALRLAGKLRLSIVHSTDGEAMCMSHDVGASITEPAGKDPCAATRRAIVRAAAALGVHGK